MNQLLSLSKAAKLASVRRSELQQKIRQGELPTFEGMIDPQDLARCFPNKVLDYNPEYERVQQIKDKAFGKRVLERILPSAEVLALRISDLGRDLMGLHTKISQQKNLLDRLSQSLQVSLQSDGSLSAQQAKEMLSWIDESRASLMGDISPPDNISSHQTILKVMAPHIRLLPSENEFFVEGNDSILEAGLREGLAIDYGCSNGNCGLCKAKVLSGEAMRVKHNDYQISESEKNAGYILMCCHTPVTDMVIEAAEAGSVTDLPKQQINTKVKTIETLSNDMLLLHLQTPRTNRLRFFAGQSVTLHPFSGSGITLPVASCPCDDRNLHFHIPRKTLPELTLYLQNNLRKGDSLELEGPVGDFVLDEDSVRPLLMIAEDEGFAPIKSLVEHALAKDDAEHIYLYRRSAQSECYLDNLCRSWADALDNFSYFGEDETLTQVFDKIRLGQSDLRKLDVFVAARQGVLKQVQAELGEGSGVRYFALL